MFGFDSKDQAAKSSKDTKRTITINANEKSLYTPEALLAELGVEVETAELV